MTDFFDFLREKRASVLIGGGAIIFFVWLLVMINYGLFSLLPFGTGLSMGWTLTIFIPTGVILLLLTYFGGSEDSPINGLVHEVARFVYVSFKNSMIFLAMTTILFGIPRMQYYQLRASESSGLAQLSYYEQRTLFNLFQDGSQIIDATSDYSEDPSSGFVPMPEDSVDIDSDSSSSRSNSDDFLGKILEALLTALLFLAVILAVIFYFSLVILCFIFPNFWLVAVVCISFGMITLGIIDIHDGPII